MKFYFFLINGVVKRDRLYTRTYGDYIQCSINCLRSVFVLDTSPHRGCFYLIEKKTNLQHMEATETNYSL